MKNLALGIILICSALPAAAHAQYSSPPGFFWPYGTGIGAPREVLTVHAWGPTDPPPYHRMGSNLPSYQPYYPSYNYPSYQTYQPSYQPMYQPYQQFYPQYSQYSYGQNFYENYSYSYPSMNYSGYGYAPQSYSYYPQPTGGTDFLGKPLCNWGDDYRGYACDRDPHQWIFDPYTGSWY